MIWNKNTIQLLKPVKASDGQGGWITGYAEHSTFTGRISRKSASERMVAMQEKSAAFYRLYCNIGVQVAYGDRVKLGGLEYNVVSKPLTPSQGGHQEVDLEMVL
jgi:SPP1 family predicted phage head-tail adaptor